jgi:hypothetical protein
MIQRLKREAEIWRRLKHRNVLPFLGAWDEPAAPWPALISPFYKFGHLQRYLRDCPTVDREMMVRHTCWFFTTAYHYPRFSELHLV